MKRANLAASIAAAVLTAGASLHAWGADPATLRYGDLMLRSDAGDDHLSVEAEVVTRWGRGQARLLAARAGDGGLDGSTRAWWQSDLPALGSSLRVGSQQAVATFMRSALDLTGVGLAGRLAPVLLDYALSVGRLDEQAVGPPASAAWLRRRLGNEAAVALHALHVGSALEVGAALDTLGAGPGIGRWGLVQSTRPGAAQTRLVSDQRLRLRGATLQARADRVLAGCAAAAGAGLVPMPASDGCANTSADAAVDLLPNWQMQIGSSYQLRADDTASRQRFVAAVWQARPGLRLSVTLHQRGVAEGGQSLGAALSAPLSVSF